MPQELLHCDSDIFGDLTQQDGRKIASGVEWNGCTPTIDMPKLFVGAALTNLLEPQSLQNRDDLARLENWYSGHLRNFGGLDSYKLRLNVRDTILAEHLDDLFQIRVELIKSLGLRMGAGKAWYVTHIKSVIRATLDYCGIGFHIRAPISSDAEDSSRMRLRA